MISVFASCFCRSATRNSIPLTLYCSGYFTELVQTGGTGHREDRANLYEVAASLMDSPVNCLVQSVLFGFGVRRFKMKNMRLLNALWVQVLERDNL